MIRFVATNDEVCTLPALTIVVPVSDENFTRKCSKFYQEVMRLVQAHDQSCTSK